MPQQDQVRSRTAGLPIRPSMWATLLVLVPLGWNVGARAAEGPSTQLADGDRVVFLGSTFIERMQEYGYLETLLTMAEPAKEIRFRNLGWSGDTVLGEARALFGTTSDGFARLQADLLAARPTVVLASYGGNEAHAGAAGLASFREGLVNLLAAIEKTGARLVFLGPRRYEQPTPLLPLPAGYHESLRQYTAVIREEVERMGGQFADGFGLGAEGLTENGVHPTELGYWSLAPELARVWSVTLPDWEVTLDAGPLTADARGTTVSGLARSGQGVRFECLDRCLPSPPPPWSGPLVASAWEVESRLRVRGLAPGQYLLRIDGQDQVRGSERQWARGIRLPARGGARQVAELRAAVRRKNALYFHRHRPQNETYLLLFRRHEQGNNAVEIQQFDPLIEAQEMQIAQWKQPRRHVYELVSDSRD